ncbi:MAG: VWA domain-containing protein [Rhizobiaceae bacterium]
MATNKTQAKSGNVVVGKTGGKAAVRSSSKDVAAFLKAAKSTNPAGTGRLVFSLDATMSRQPTWDRACQIQASMFEAVSKIGGLSVQLVYFRGFGECKASRWVVNSSALADLMCTIDCRGGQTQIIKVLNHASKENEREKISALVYIGDAMEEDADRICHLAGQLGLKGVRAFMFQEGHDPLAESTFRQVAKLTGGAYFRLGPNSARELAELLGAIAVYASAGRKALESSSKRGARLLLGQVPGSGS